MTPVGFPRRVLAIGAHPDDIELFGAGTLARFAATGAHVEWIVVCRGDRGGTLPPDQLATQRQAETRESANLLGSSVHFLNVPDASVGDGVEARPPLLELLRSIQPDLVLTHSPDDYHIDHVDVSRLVASCCWFASSPGHLTAAAPLDRPIPLAYFDHLAGIGFEPTHYVDVTSTFDLKRRMLACHQSQTNRSDSGMHALSALCETLARLRGFQCGVAHAEAFRVPTLFGRRRPEPIFP